DKEELAPEAKAQQLRYGVVQIARLALTSLSSGSQSTSATSTAPERCERPGLSSSGSWPFGWCAAARATLAWLHCGLAFPAADRGHTPRNAALIGTRPLCKVGPCWWRDNAMARILS